MAYGSNIKETFVSISVLRKVFLNGNQPLVALPDTLAFLLHAVLGRFAFAFPLRCHSCSFLRCFLASAASSIYFFIGKVNHGAQENRVEAKCGVIWLGYRKQSQHRSFW